MVTLAIDIMSGNKTVKILGELALWAGLYGLWIFVFRNHTITITRTMGIEFCYLVFIALNFYFISYVAIPRFFTPGKYIPFFLFAFLSTVAAAIMRAGVAYYITTAMNNTPAGFQKLCINSMLNISIWTVTLMVLKLLLDKRRQVRHTEALEKERITTELNFLKSQHDPHFLFNSLNALYFQIDKQNNSARETLLKLSEMLRYQLYELNTETISIEKEIGYLQNYIELQKVRLNENYKIGLSTGAGVHGFTIAPLLILPLVENAFKYISHYADKTNSVAITLETYNSTFTCTVANTTEEQAIKKTSADGGIGLKNLERRLELIYPNTHKLAATLTNGIYEATLSITI